MTQFKLTINKFNAENNMCFFTNGTDEFPVAYNEQKDEFTVKKSVLKEYFGLINKPNKVIKWINMSFNFCYNFGVCDFNFLLNEETNEYEPCRVSARGHFSKIPSTFKTATLIVE